MLVWNRHLKLLQTWTWLDWLQNLAFCGVISLAVWARWPSHPSPLLWLDEAWRAYYVSITRGPLSFLAFMRDTSEMLLASEWLQAKISWHLAGSNPFAFRIWTLFFSAASVAGVIAVMCRAGQRELALLPAVTIALALGFVYHGREFKPYAMDLSLTFWTIWACLRAVEIRRYAMLVFFLTLLAFSSLVFVFIYPAVVAFLWYRVRPFRWKILGALSFPPLLFLLIYMFFLRQQGAASTMSFWEDHYLTGLSAARGLINDYPTFVRIYLLHNWVLYTLLYFLILPLFSAIRRDGLWILLLAPFGILLLASAARLYPLLDRPCYFWYGIFVAGAALGVGYIVDGICPNRAKTIKLSVVLLALLAIPLQRAFRANLDFARAWPPETARRSMEVLAEKFAEGDQLAINDGVYFTFLFHWSAVFDEDHPLRSVELPRLDSLVSNLDDNMVRHSLANIIDPGTKGFRLWLMSGFSHRAYRLYESVLSPLGDLQVLVNEPFQTLVFVDMEKPLSQIVNQE